MKHLRVVSDLHLDFDGGLPWLPPPMDGDSDTMLLIAGDIWRNRRFLKKRVGPGGEVWLQMVARQFKHVALVLGNHDFWGVNLTNEVERCRSAVDLIGLTNVSVLDRHTATIDQVKVVGATFWTNYNNQNPIAMLDSAQRMNDYRYVRVGSDYRRARPSDFLDEHHKSKSYIVEAAVRDHEGQTLVVLTHMAPSMQSIHPRWGVNDVLWPSYASNLDELVYQVEPNYWFHGHVHDVMSYHIGDTHVVCNPRGYVGESSVGFNPRLRFDL